MPFREKAGRWLQTIDYGYLLPGMGTLPLPLGERLSRLRGLAQFAMDYDWRSLSLKRRFIRSATFQAMQIIMPEAHRLRWFKSTMLRFVHHSREEWQACLYSREVMGKIMDQSRIEGLEQLKRYRKEGRGVVLISCHLDSFCMGMVLLGMHGLPTNVINTSEIENPEIHPQVRAFFQRKYMAMEQRMHGRMPYYQTDKAFFYQALKRGELVTLMGDVPGSKSTVHISFLGRKFRMPLGAWHMAKKTESLVGGYVCLHEGIGKYRVVCMTPREINVNDPVCTLGPVYEFLEHWIRKMPERWIAADLLAGY